MAWTALIWGSSCTLRNAAGTPQINRQTLIQAMKWATVVPAIACTEGRIHPPAPDRRRESPLLTTPSPAQFQVESCNPHVRDRPSSRCPDPWQRRRRPQPGPALERGLSVAVVSKRELTEGSTLYAQGGISAVLDAKDSVDSHVQDTLRAGAGLCDRVVRQVVERGPHNIRWLLDQGVAFTRSEEYGSAGGYHLTREGGHTHRRVVHAADATGRAVATTLEAGSAPPQPEALRAAHRRGSDHPASSVPGREPQGPLQPLHRGLCAGSRNRAGGDLSRPLRGARHRRGQQGLPLHQQPGRLHRRRHRHGLARRLPGGQHGVHAVPPHLPLSP
jgi:hypothetical protein